MRRTYIILLSLALLGMIAVAASALCGSSGCVASPDFDEMLWQLRFPRTVSAFAVGGLLALSGAVMQLLLRNPLADPYVLGVSGGAAVGAMGSSLLASAGLLGLSARWSMHAGALVGALTATGLLFGIARRALLRISPDSAGTGVRLILTGVMIAAGFGAFITLMLSMASDTELRGMIFWLMGDLENSILYGPALAVLCIAVIWAVLNASRLNVLAHGDATAQLLGVPVVRLRIMALLIASFATAAAVSVGGTIGFVGLVVPHGLRMVIGNDQRILLPSAALAGGTVLTLADLLARTIVAPIQLPVGVITALVGVPLFLVLLTRSRS
jgi:iron complex transport system permease protein